MSVKSHLQSYPCPNNINLLWDIVYKCIILRGKSRNKKMRMTETKTCGNSTTLDPESGIMRRTERSPKVLSLFYRLKLTLHGLFGSLSSYLCIYHTISKGSWTIHARFDKWRDITSSFWFYLYPHGKSIYWDLAFFCWLSMHLSSSSHVDKLFGWVFTSLWMHRWNKKTFLIYFVSDPTK